MSQTIQSLLEEACVGGSKADRALANYMVSAFAELPFETASSIASKVQVSEATVGRFCRSIGFKSFKDLKSQLKPEINGGPWLVKEHLAELRSSQAAGSYDLSKGMELEIASLVKIYQMTATEPWKRAVGRMAHCDKVFIAGFQTERGQAQYLANQLQYLRDGVELLDLSSGNFTELLLSEGDNCLVIFEARRYSRVAKVLLTEAAEHGIPVTLITDVFCDWGGEGASEIFRVQTQFNQFWDSTAHMAVLTNLLMNGIFMKLGPEVETRLKKTAKLYQSFTGHVGDPAGQLKT